MSRLTPTAEHQRRNDLQILYALRSSVTTFGRLYAAEPFEERQRILGRLRNAGATADELSAARRALRLISFYE